MTLNQNYEQKEALISFVNNVAEFVLDPEQFLDPNTKKIMMLGIEEDSNVMDPECSSSIKDIQSYLDTVFDELKWQIEASKKETVKENEITDKTNGVMARKVEEKLNGLEVMAANLMQNIAYARSELLKKADEYEEKITANKTTLYLITGYTKEAGVWEVELFRDYNEAVNQFKLYVEGYNAELDEDNPNFAMCPDGIGRFWLEERTI